MPKLKIELTIDMPYDIRGGKRELREYIKDAVAHWGGQRHPEDWLFDGCRKVTVGAVREVSND